MPPRLLSAIMIPIAAAAAVSAISYAPFGDVFRTLRSIGAEEIVAPVMLSGMEKAEVQIIIGSKESRASQIRIALREHDVSSAKRVSLTIPRSWQISEVRGVHIAAINESHTNDSTTLSIPIPPADIELIFFSGDAFDSIAFSHDSEMPALVVSAHIDLPQNKIQEYSSLVDRSESYTICTFCT